MRRYLARGLAIVVGIGLAVPAQAVTIHYLIEGVVSGGTWSTTGHEGLGVFAPGTPSSLSFDIDSETLETPAGAIDPDRGIYPIGESGGFFVGVLEVGFFPLTMLGEGALGIASTPVLNVQNGGPLTAFDTLTIGAQVIEPPCDPIGPGCPGVPVIHQLGILFGQPLGAWFDGTAIPIGISLPPPPFVPSHWSLQSESGELLVQFTPTSLSAVPEPGALPLVGIAALLVARAFTRRR